ncbi:MAG: PorT family protein [Tannerella sp.]|jgi:hypothetical protein|nr:PorT family protein [Tannerella sp.]
MMKRNVCIYLTALLLFPMTAFGQFHIGVKGGLNIAEVKFNSGAYATDNITGFHLGPMLELMTPLGIGIDGAVLFSQKGTYVKEAGSSASLKSNFIEVPVNLKWKIELPVIKPFLAAGPYAAFRISGKNFNVDKNWIQGQFETRSFGAGLNFTGGLELFGKLQAGLTYNMGLTNDYGYALETHKFDGKTRTWIISAAWLF